MQIQKTHKQNNIKINEKNSHLHNTTMEICWPSSPGHGARLRVWLMFSDTPLEKTAFPFPAGVRYR